MITVCIQMCTTPTHLQADFSIFEFGIVCLSQSSDRGSIEDNSEINFLISQ